jgi:outer membrane protein assembly factor BamE (lipoprotein component of BamABCDE complex)
MLRKAMSPLRTMVAVVIAACVADCAAERTQIANYAQNKMVGLTKEQVLACMGPPASKATEGATEVWSYPSGNCTVNVTMMDGKVKRMNYVGSTGGLLSQNEQCFFTVANCTY